MFSFLPLINNSVTIGLIFSVSKNISNYIIKNNQYFSFFIWIIIVIVFINIIHIIRVFIKSFRIIERFLNENWYFASYRSLAYKYIYHYLVFDLLDSIMNLLFQIQSFQLLIFYMDDLEFVANLSFFMFSFTTSSELITFCIVLLHFYI